MFKKNLNQKIYALLQSEIRLQFFQSIEIKKKENSLIYFKSPKFIFYGYKIESLKMTYDSNNEYEEYNSHIGIMIFFSGEIYIGEFDENLFFNGEGLFFFSVGALVRGIFKKGKLDGKCLISFPFNVCILANFNNGILTQNLEKIDFNTNKLTKLKYALGQYKSVIEILDFDKNILEVIKDKMDYTMIPDNMDEFKNRDTNYFGSFLKDDSLFFGFIKNGMPKGWGLKMQFGNSETDFINLPEINWEMKNFDLEKNEDNFIISYFDKKMIYGINNNGDYNGEICVYYPEENKFEQLDLKNEKNVFGEKNEYEGIPKNFLTGLISNYFIDIDIEKKDINNIVSIIFNMQYFKEVIFFYLYGSLKRNVSNLFPDYIEIVTKSFFLENLEKNNSSWTDSDIQSGKNKIVTTNLDLRRNVFEKNNKLSKTVQDKNFNNQNKTVFSEFNRKHSINDDSSNFIIPEIPFKNLSEQKSVIKKKKINNFENEKKNLLENKYKKTNEKKEKKNYSEKKGKRSLFANKEKINNKHIKKKFSGKVERKNGSKIKINKKDKIKKKKFNSTSIEYFSNNIENKISTKSTILMDFYNKLELVFNSKELKDIQKNNHRFFDSIYEINK